MGIKQSMPRKGTKRRELLRLLFRSQGMRSDECPIGQHNSKGAVDALRNDFGFDIREFKEPHTGRRVKRRNVYKVVGWDRPNGRYRSFVKVI
jgi:hypothetical protein